MPAKLREQHEAERTRSRGSLGARVGVSPVHAHLVALQCSVGNRAVAAALRTGQVQRTAKYDKRQGKWLSDHPSLLNKKYDDKKAAEKAEAAARAEAKKPVVGPSPLPSGPDTGGAFELVKSKAEEVREARAAVDVEALATHVNDFTGPVGAIAVSFSQLVNALEAQNALVMGHISEKYWDRPAETKWSVAASVDKLSKWEIHAHCELTGATASGTNAIHIKRVSEKWSRGVSVALTPRQEGLLIPAAGVRAAARFTRGRRPKKKAA